MQRNCEDLQPCLVATHRRRFHADEVFAVAILRLAGYKPSVMRIARDNTDVLNLADFRLDIGQRFQPSSGDFDHHQPQGAGQRHYSAPYNVPYATAGLVWQSFGLSICEGDRQLMELVDRQMIIHVDASDVGAKLFQGSAATLPALIGRHNGPDVDDDDAQMQRFMAMVDLAEMALHDIIANGKREHATARKVSDALARHDGGKTLVLDQLVDWRDAAPRRMLRQKGIDVLLMPLGEEVAIHLTNNEHTFPNSWRNMQHQLQEVLRLPGRVAFANARQARAENLETAQELARLLHTLNTFNRTNTVREAPPATLVQQHAGG